MEKNEKVKFTKKNHYTFYMSYNDLFCTQIIKYSLKKLAYK